MEVDELTPAEALIERLAGAALTTSASLDTRKQVRDVLSVLASRGTSEFAREAMRLMDERRQ